jgi:thioesterase domain-containing protein/acyl carrier protein
MSGDDQDSTNLISTFIRQTKAIIEPFLRPKRSRRLPLSPSQISQAFSHAWKSELHLTTSPLSEARFFDLGGDSVAAVNLLAFVENNFGVELSISLFLQNPTLGELISEICKKALSHQKEFKPIPLIQPIGQGKEGYNKSPLKHPLFLIPGGFGGENELLVFAALRPHIKSDRPIYGFQVPTDLFLDSDFSIEKLAEQYITAIKATQAEGPYLIAGECVAGVIGYEIAYQLEQQGETLHRLFLLDAHCPTEKGAAYFRENGLRSLNVIHGKEKARQIFPYYQALYDYVPPKTRLPTSVIVSEASKSSMSEDLGWNQSLLDACEILYVPGDHDSYIREHAAATGKLLDEAMNRYNDGQSEKPLQTPSE